MKLIQIFVLILITTINVETNDNFNGPTQYPRPGPVEGYSTEGSKYLPPELHTSVPYIPMKNVNNLQYQYLPATVTKAPMRFPPLYPLIMSTTLMPFEDDDEHENRNHHPTQNHFQRNNQFQNNNRTERNDNFRAEQREFKPKANYHQVDRIDSKTPMGFTQNVQTATPRSFIIGTETKQSDAIDQIKLGSYPGPQYIPAPGLQNIFVSSTTEPAIPILRLSNEMDLDGSFSYEALGADQTHYVQHSRMENMGTDKEEQVVEGSYSYVGDNGQTYTVHYIADSNGFRASGDHLPVAPPVPEIIQRAVQYNLAEEAKKPPHLKSWQNNEDEFNENENYQGYSTTKNLFTGRTPESFSFAFSQGQNPQNNLVTAASTQIPMKAHPEFHKEQNKPNTNVGPISPQVTFMASQGAHNPRINPPQPERMFTNERSPMPQLINYDAANQENEENNKALWRWQYGLNANNVQQASDNQKNSISRSFGEDDEVVVNFNNMTPEQYTNMLKSELEPKIRVEKDEIDQNRYVTVNSVQVSTEKENLATTTEFTTNRNLSETWYQNVDDNYGYFNSNDYNNFKSESVEGKNNKNLNEKVIPTESQNVVSSHDNHNNFKHNNQWYNSNQMKNEPDQTYTEDEGEVGIENLYYQDYVFNEKPSTTESPTTTDIVQMFEKNIFLRNILKVDKSKQIERNKIRDDATKFLPKIKPETKIQSKYTSMNTQVKPNPFLEIQGIRKPLDAGEILNYITVRNHFDSAKTKPSNNKVAQNPKTLKIFKNSDEDDHLNESLRYMRSNNKQEESNGFVKKYKVLQRNRNNPTQDKQQFEENLLRPNVRTLQSSNLPPLGRAGPSMKSYLPPIFV